MRPLLVNTYDAGGGAARAALRLHEGLRRIGVESRLLVGFRRGGGAGVVGPGSALAGAWAGLRARLDSLPARRYPGRRRSLFSAAFLPERLASRVAALGPDLVHLHWIAHGMARIETLKHLPRPIVWTLHDSWAFTGGCHVPFGCTRYREACGACPALGSSRDPDLSRRVWRRKREAWAGLDLTIVTPSRWLGARARSSALLAGARFEVIPNGLDLERFHPAPREEARARLGLPADRKLILFAASEGATDPNKGLDLLLDALGRLRASGRSGGIELVLLGAGLAPVRERAAVPVHPVGEFDDDGTLAALYAAADAFVAPSLLENLSYAVMEAAACGTPCVAFDAGGTPDLIEHRGTGYLARAHEAEDLAEGIAWTLGDPARARALGERARRKVEDGFELSSVARRYRDLYEILLARATPRAPARRRP